MQSIRVGSANERSNGVASRWKPRRAGRRPLAALALGGALLLATACGSAGVHPGGAAVSAGAGGNAGAGGAGATSVTAKPSAAVLDVEPKNGAQDVPPSGALKVSVTSGKLTQVAVTGPDGQAVAGAVAADGLSWVPTAGLAVGTAYKVSAQAVDAAGVRTTATNTFSTLTPSKTTRTDDNVTTNETYGVGMIIRVDFQKAVKNKAAVEKAITVQASDNTVVKGHWFDGDTRLDLRPESYWKPGTKVAVHFRTKSVEFAPGVYGNSDRDESFTIGRSKITTVDAQAHRMTVAKDGAAPQTIAITAGSDDNPSYNGTMVVFQKTRMEHMDSATTTIKGAAYSVDEPHAMKITDSGTYVHGNPKAGAVAGRQNISHGCVGLPDTEDGDDNSVAGRFYADSILGDVVIVKNSIGKDVQPDNGLGGWNMPWSAW
ncbi:Ig-like domain-containing protein [Kitasatospora kazusensis]|uniref:Ig-like domain-containing protein n=1 Tax=Kitasatospora kazusensis TaxID=407974 RepID=A0ABN2ZI68_9ACTN